MFAKFSENSDLKNSLFLHKQSWCDSMNSLFVPTLAANISVHFESVFIAVFA